MVSTMRFLTHKFVYLNGELEVRPSDETEGHYALAYEMVHDRDIDIDALADLGGGNLYASGEHDLFEVVFWPELEGDESLRLEIEAKLSEWAAEKGFRLQYGD